MSEKELVGKAAIVTGGAGAFGTATGFELAGRGAAVVVADLDGAAAERVAADIRRKTGASTLAVGCDVREESSVAKMVESTIAAFSRVDILVNNAGIFPMGPLAETTVERWDEIMAVNVRGVFLCCKHAIPHMSERNAGCIVNISSAVGRVALPNLVPYSASKAAVIAMTVGLAKELGPRGIRVNAVCPSTVSTPGWAEPRKVLSAAMGLPEDQVLDVLVQGQVIKRMLTPEEIARVVAWLASDATSMVTGQAIGIDGGIAFPTY